MIVAQTFGDFLDQDQRTGLSPAERLLATPPVRFGARAAKMRNESANQRLGWAGDGESSMDAFGDPSEVASRGASTALFRDAASDPANKTRFAGEALTAGLDMARSKKIADAQIAASNARRQAEQERANSSWISSLFGGIGKIVGAVL